MKRYTLICVALGLALTGCLSDDPEGLYEAKPAAITVKMDFYNRPLPEIPLPNDIATRADASSPTGRRVNASMIAPTRLEGRVRELIDQLDGWGVFQPITIPFTGPIDVQSVLDGHRDKVPDLSNDVIYLVNVDRDSPEFGKLHHLDVGNGNFPVILERRDYWDNGLRANSLSMFFEETDEDVNGNGVLDPGEDANRNGELDPGEDVNGNGVLDPPEDSDADGVLDKPNYLPGANPDPNDLAARADALMTFYEKQTNTLIVRPMVPLEERTTYAVVVTRRIKDENGDPVGSPFAWINHVGQNKDLEALPEVLPQGLSLEDIAFTYSFTTQTIESDWVAVREGLYGHGVQKHLAEEFPAKLASVEPMRSASHFPQASNLHILYNEQWITVLEQLAGGFFDIDNGSREYQALINSQQYIDFHAIGSFKSPQLFAREDAQGNFLPLNDQSWPVDLAQKPAQARSEDVLFWLVTPRPEISARGAGKPAPLVVLGHGYSSNRLEALIFVGYLVQNGFAVLALDNVSHGLAVDESTQNIVRTLLGAFGLEPFGENVLRGRAFDQNNDGEVDSGADFWTAYLFHTRDVVRQSLLDYVQFVRILRTFDGQQRWDFDLNGDGVNELAGDFDADGVVDISASETLGATGGSLGGIMSSLLGSVEPEVDVIAPISGGGGLGDIGARSAQGGVREAVNLRVLAPRFHGVLDTGSGVMAVSTVVPDLNDDAEVPVAQIEGVKVGDTMRVVNLHNHELGCGYVSGEGRVATGIAADKGDVLQVEIYRGPALVTGSEECEVVEGAEPYKVISTFEVDFERGYQGMEIAAGMQLVALADGFGLRRAHPEVRRFLYLGQLVLDGADPAVYAKHLSHKPLHYPNMGEYTHANAMIVTTMGDMSVPASSGVSIGRAAGFIDYLNPDPRYAGTPYEGLTPNQILINTYAAEAVNDLKRFTFASDPSKGIHLDIENFSQGTDLWGSEVPRLDPPLHLWSDTNAYGEDIQGISGSIFPYPVPEGQHGFPFPGQLSDATLEQCERLCPEGQDCACDELDPFDVGYFMFNMMAVYFKNNGKYMNTDLCLSSNTCAHIPPPPAPRDRAELDAR